MIAEPKTDAHVQHVLIGHARWKESNLDSFQPQLTMAFFSIIKSNVSRLRKWRVQESRIPLLQSGGSMQQVEGLLRWNQQTTCPQVTATVAALLAACMCTRGLQLQA